MIRAVKKRFSLKIIKSKRPTVAFVNHNAAGSARGLLWGSPQLHFDMKGLVDLTGLFLFAIVWELYRGGLTD